MLFVTNKACLATNTRNTTQIKLPHSTPIELHSKQSQRSLQAPHQQVLWKTPPTALPSATSELNFRTARGVSRCHTSTSQLLRCSMVSLWHSSTPLTPCVTTTASTPASMISWTSALCTPGLCRVPVSLQSQAFTRVAPVLSTHALQSLKCSVAVLELALIRPHWCFI